MRSEDFDRAAALVDAAESVALACHVGPDGDALGSMLAMAVALDRRGKSVYPSFGRPFTSLDMFRFLPTDLLVPPEEVPEAADLMMSFDAGSLDRLGDLAGLAAGAGALVVLDHHASNPGFGTVDLIDGDAAATAEVVYRLLNVLGWEVDAVIAECLLTGLVTDTGRFQYSNTTPATLELAAALVDAGARPERISRHVYEESPYGFLLAAGRVLGRSVLEPDLKLVWSVLTKEDLETCGIGMEDTDPLIDIIRVAQESDVAALIKELDGGRIKVSMRSRGRVDVGAIAVALGGGGHHNAAGFTHAGSPEEAMDAVRSRLAG